MPRSEKYHSHVSGAQVELASPFLTEELFVEESAPHLEQGAAALLGESPFAHLEWSSPPIPESVVETPTSEMGGAVEETRSVSWREAEQEETIDDHDLESEPVERETGEGADAWEGESATQELDTLVELTKHESPEHLVEGIYEEDGVAVDETRTVDLEGESAGKKPVLQYITHAGPYRLAYDRLRALGVIEALPGRRRRKFRGTAALQAALNKWGEFIPRIVNPPEFILTGGLYVDKSGEHGTGNAIDVDGFWWSETNRFLANDAPSDWVRYLTIEATLRKAFGTVLNYDYNKAHRDHWHCDLGTPIRWRAVRSQVNFVQRALKAIWGEDLSVDGRWGSFTRAAATRNGFDFTAPDTWDRFLDTIIERRSLPAPGPSPAPEPKAQPTGAISNWVRIPIDQRMAYVMKLLVDQYGYPVNGAAGLVGNLLAESGVLPNRIEGSNAATPMRARDFSGAVTDFTAEQVMNRSATSKIGPRRPGIGLAQWTTRGRRNGLFKHRFRGRVPGAAILDDMDAQVDYLISELKSSYRRIDGLLRNPDTPLESASEEVVYSFEIPGSILTAPGPDGKRKRLPRDNPAVQRVFQRRREGSRRALRVYRSAQQEAEEGFEWWQAEAEDADQDELEVTTDEEGLEFEIVDEAEDEGEVQSEYANDESADLEDRELDPDLMDLAEKVFARETPFLELQSPRRWTRCFAAADIAKVQKAYVNRPGFRGGHLV